MPVPVSLADTLLRIAEQGLYRPVWTDLILAEAQEAIADFRPGTDTTKRFADMRKSFSDALVTGWEELVAGIHLPDEDDRHVVAAAIRGGADVIVTANLSDFPAKALKALDLEVVHPDDFLLDLLDLSPTTVVNVIREQAACNTRPPLTPHDLVAILGRAGVPKFAAEALRLHRT